MRTIALEEHFVTQNFLKATGAYAGPAHAATVARTEDLKAKLLDIGEGRIAAMDESGITMQVLSLAAIGIDALDAATSEAVLRDVNDEAAAAVRAHPNRFAAFATLPLKNPNAAARELERCVREHGFVGAMLDGTVDGRFLDAAEFTPVWEAAEALNVPVYVHPAPPPETVKNAYFSGLPGETGEILSIAGWGWHAETGLHTLRLILSGLFDRLPKLQVIIGHMGEGLPYAMARTGGILSGVAPYLGQPVQDYFQTNIHITTSGYFTRPPFECADAVLGIDRILFSVDYPFSPNTRGRAFLDALNPMTNDRRLKLVQRNAESLLRLHVEEPGA